MNHVHFHDLTHLLGYYKDKKYVKDGDWEMYKSKIKKYIKNVIKSSILTNILGSDHCPVKLNIII